MSPGLKDSFQIASLAADLRLSLKNDPVTEILTFCHGRVNAIYREFRSTTLSELMNAAAATLDALFIEIHDQADLSRVRTEYLARRELAFATLAEQLGPSVYAITFKLTQPRDFDRRFVSIIDCRGVKASRRYFSKWHELAHLLTLTSQARLKFCRTHARPEEKDPEEALMDVIAGEVGFCPPLVRPHAKGDISYEKISTLRERLCLDASEQASLIGFVKAWPTPCILVEARRGLRAHERRSLRQERFTFHDGPAEVLRAVKVTANSAARRAGIFIHPNMRVPGQSVIARVLEDNMSSLTAEEDLAWWTSSDGRGLTPRRVTVNARRRWDAVEALIVPV